MAQKYQRETYATGMVKPKTTALFFDKLWVHPLLIKGFINDDLDQYGVPPDVCLTGPTGKVHYYEHWVRQTVYELRFRMNRDKMDIAEQLRWCELETWDLRSIFQIEAIQHFEETETPHWKEIEKKLPQYNGYEYKDEAFKIRMSTQKRNKAIDFIVELYAKRGIKLTPVYLTSTEFSEVNIREIKGIEICLDSIPAIDESELTWEQVLELRKDKKAKDKLDRLRRWFATDLIKMNQEQIRATIEKKLDDYEYSLKKHGIKTIVGGITSVVSFVAGSTAINLLTSSPLAALTGGLVVASGAVAWVADTMVKKSDIKRNEIAYIYEVKKLFNGK